MADLITIAEAKAHLRIDSTLDDAWLAIFIPVVSDAIRTWLKASWRLYVPITDSAGDPVVDSAGETLPLEDSNGPVVRPVVKAAALVELASQYRYREGEGDNVVTPDAGHGYILSKGATAILAGLRKSTVA